MNVKKGKTPEGKTVKLPLDYSVLFTKNDYDGSIIIYTREHIKDASLFSSSLLDDIKPKWVEELLKRNEIYGINVGYHTIVIEVVAATNKYSAMGDLWNDIREGLEKEVLDRTRTRI